MVLKLLSDKKGLVVYGQTRSSRSKYRHFKNKMVVFTTDATSLTKKQQDPSYLTTTLSMASLVCL